jgi:hypothetical protein
MKLTIVSLFLFSTLLHASSLGCGIFKVRGVFRVNSTNGVVLVVNEHTLSEIKLVPSKNVINEFNGPINIEVEVEIGINFINKNQGHFTYFKNLNISSSSNVFEKQNEKMKKIKNEKCQNN